jgi:hypothetical protein
MITKPWYVKKQVQSFVRQKDQLVHRTFSLPHKKNRRRHDRKTGHTQRKPNKTCAFPSSIPCLALMGRYVKTASSEKTNLKFTLFTMYATAK